MRLAVLLRFAVRNVLRNRRRSLLTSMAVAGGVAVLVFVRGMQDGFVEGRLERGLLLQLGHAVVKSGSRVIADGALLARELEKIGAVKAASPRTRFQGILKAGGRAAGVQGLGVDAGDESRASLLPASIVAGRFLGEPSKPGTVPLTLGVHLAKELDVGLGETVALIVEGDDGALVAERGEVTGLYETGGVSADRACVYVPRGAANELLLTEGDCSEVMLRLTAGSASESLAARLQRTAADLGLTVESWKVLAPELDATLRILTAMERTRNAVLLGLVGLLLLNTLTLSVFERRREFGVLLAVGLSELALLALVALETVLLTAAGLGAGLVLGASAASGFPFRTGYDFGGLGRQWTGALEATGVVEPILTLDNVLTASAWVAILTFAALLLPAWRVLRLEPAAALKEAPG